MRVALVTGGAGFIGSHLVNRLLDEGFQVRVLDDFSSGSVSNLPLSGDLELVEGDTRNLSVCRAACSGVEYVFHMAAVSSVPSSIADPVASHAINLSGTVNLLVAARDHGVKRFVFSSSASVYGNTQVVPTSEDVPVDPRSPYASGKASAEFYCRNFHQLSGLETVILRYFNVYGPRQSAKSGYAAVIPKFVQAAISGTTPIIYGDGLQTRDFVYVSDVAEANLLACHIPDAQGKTFNVAGGNSVSLLGLLEELSAITGRPLIPEFRPTRQGDIRHSRADTSKALDLLVFCPAVSLADGLMRTLRAANDHLDTPSTSCLTAASRGTA